MAPGTEGGFTKIYPEGKVMSVYEAAMEYKKRGIDLVVVAGREYGAGSSRDWAAKGTKLLGVKAVIVESFERIHRSNLIGMGILPLQFKEGLNRKKLNIKGSELFTIIDIEKNLEPRQDVDCEIKYDDGTNKKIKLFIQVNIAEEHQNSGILLHDLDKFYNYCTKELSLNIIGLMCLPPINNNSSQYFKIFKKKSEELNLTDLSMGMSSDYEQATLNGSTFLRLGTIIFGERNI